MNDNFSELIKESGGLPVVSSDLERRVMIEVARRALAQARRRAKRGMVASLAGLAMLLVGCIAVLVMWYPTLMPALMRFSWLEQIRISLPQFGPAAGADGSAFFLPFVEQWGGLVLLVMLIGGVAGFVYYLNSAFFSDYNLD